MRNRFAIYASVVVLCGLANRPHDRALAAELLALRNGVHLLVDDYYIDRSEGVERKVNQPQRFRAEPVVTGSLDHQNWQPFLTVLHDPAAPAGKRFRMWYNVDVLDDPRDGQWFGKTGYLESADGIRWPGPYVRLNSLTEDGRVRFGASVLDDGPQHPAAAERYKMLYWDVGKLIGPRVAFSPDGLQWSVHDGGKPILPKTPSDDIWTAGYDPIRQRYYLIGKQFGPYTWTNAEGEKLTVPIRRYFTSFSRDFKTWSDPEGMVYSPDEKDSGITQWYGSAGFQVAVALPMLAVARPSQNRVAHPRSAAAAEQVCTQTRPAAVIGASRLGRRAIGGQIVPQHAQESDDQVAAHVFPSANLSIDPRSGIRWPRTCGMMATISARSRNCWGTRT
jgi:hypothetical protein